MSDVVRAVADTLRADGRFAVVTGRTWQDAEALVEAGTRHVVAPGLSTRLAVARGFALGAHRAVALVDRVPEGPAPAGGTVAFTTAAECARDALNHGWTVIQPWNAQDVPALLAAGAERPVMVLLAGDGALADSDPPTARRTRLWLDGELATLVGSGVAVPPMVRLASRLQQRGVDIAAVEVALLDTPAQAPLVAGGALLVGGRDTAGTFRGERWPDLPVATVPLEGRAEADVIGAVLAVVSAAR